MELIVIMGPQAVGKMTIGQELEKKRKAKLLYNHQTIDLYANFLGYSKEAFKLSDQTRVNLFRAFVENKSNVVNGIIFTVVVAFDVEGDIQFLKEIKNIFKNAGGSVYFIELQANMEKRLERNIGENRLKMKPSKRNIEFSRKELISSAEKYRLNSLPSEINTLFPDIPYLKIDQSNQSAQEAAEQIQQFITTNEANSF